VRLIAFYLPQFHPIPENDAWWGAGFTEWTNVTRAKPLFPGHYQPHIPGHLGFYDLRLPETRTAQAELAEAHGIEGFCYWHYWFEGKRLLERPFQEVLSSGEPDFPFCLAWANESWSRRWLGEEKDILQAQRYSLGDDVTHARWLSRAFADDRYMRVRGRPLFLIYRPADLPNPLKTTEIIREQSVKNGAGEPYLLGIDAHCPGVDCRRLGFDGTLVFAPQLGFLPEFMEDGRTLAKWRRNLKLGVRSSKLKLYDSITARRLMGGPRRDFPVYPCVFVGWDNTPRRSEHAIIIESDVGAFENDLREKIVAVSQRDPEERIVFVNAWNEWAEGNHLEPDLKHGLAYLDACRRAGRGADGVEESMRAGSSGP